MAISKIRHGQEISSEKLNEIIETLNDFLTTVSLFKNQSKDLENVHNKIIKDLSALQNESNSKFESLPYLSQLIDTFIYAKTSGVQWTFKDDDNNVASKTTFFMGPYSQFPSDYVDKRILFDTTNNAIWVDHLTSTGTFSRKMWALAPSTTEDTPTIVTASAPVVNIVYDESIQNYVWQITNADGTVHTYNNSDSSHPYIPVTGSQGPRGVAGAKGEQGLQGETGPQGPQGIQGPAGTNGSELIIDFIYADNNFGLNASKDYRNQKWLGYKTYYDTADNATVQAMPYKYVRIQADTLYPYVEDGYLKFSTNPPVNADSGLYIKGEKGDVGPRGASPEIIFVDSDKQTAVTPSKLEETANGGIKVYYDSSAFKGEKGDAITITDVTFTVDSDGSAKPIFHLSDNNVIKSNQNLRGPVGPAPVISTITNTGEANTQASVTSERIDSTSYRLTFTIPQGKKGDKGDSITDAYIDNEGYLHVKSSGSSEEFVSNISLYGKKATLLHSNVSTLAPGSEASVAINLLSSQDNTYSIDFKIPRGDKGDVGLQGAQGPKGIDAYNVQLRVSNGYIQWGYVGLENWQNLIDLASLKGDPGVDGTNGTSVTIKGACQPGSLDFNTIGATGTISNLMGTLIQGEAGDGYLYNGKLAVCIEPGNFQYVGNIKGEKGDKGETGATGATGQTGPRGYPAAITKVITTSEESLTPSGTISTPTFNADTSQYEYTLTLNLVKGDKGDRGEQGIQGEKGDKGDKGDTGTRGETGPQGNPGRGIKTVITTPTENGCTVSITLDDDTSITYPVYNGSDGAKGDKGDNGDKGEKGDNGTDGFNIHYCTHSTVLAANGTITLTSTNIPSTFNKIKLNDLVVTAAGDLLRVSAIGSSEHTGARLASIKGATGENGAAGTNGTNGSTIHSGNGVPSTSTGVNGDYYLDTSTSKLHKKSSGTWSELVSLQGPKGDTGAPGEAGIDGTNFLNGYTGQVNTAPAAGKITFIY